MKKVILGAIVLLMMGCGGAKKEPLPLVLSSPRAQEIFLPDSLQPVEAEAPEEPLPPAQIDRVQAAQTLLEYHAGTKIDTYFYYMNRWYREQQAVFILEKRTYIPRVQPDGTYLLTCRARAHTGADQAHVHALYFPCGVWKVDVGLQVVLPHDTKAEKIWAD